MDAARLVDFIYIYKTGGAAPDDWLTVACNYCHGDSAVIFEGEDTSLPGTNWLAEIAAHVAERHSGQYAKMFKGL